MVTPRVVLDQHIPLAAFVLLAMLWKWAWVTLVKINLCLDLGVQSCR